jgi:trans-aconitate 2-methyltransferase
MPWNASHYLRFGNERTRPADDLAARIALPDAQTIVDLGCGPGNSTQVLRRRWPDASILGVDRSPEMIAAAGAAYPEQDWLQADIATWTPTDMFDIVFSNAVLQWLGDHSRLVARLCDFVAPGGAFAFQIPSDAYSPVRIYIREIADDPIWRDRMAGPRSALTMESPGVYYDALVGQARSLDIWETEYNHVMDSPQAIVDWISSTSLRPFLEALDVDEGAEFTRRLASRVAEGYPRRADGRVLFPFRRLFVIAYV